eukprot:GEMP01030166.1.p1 GENE.GEMP01030166.1~~GEMP01030166.1.p1  ORF type:complete len:380 (+),score=60.55 GEMP01030166.1:446-1585(+)
MRQPLNECFKSPNQGQLTTTRRWKARRSPKNTRNGTTCSMPPATKKQWLGDDEVRLGRKDLKRVMQSLGTCTNKQLQMLFRTVDQDGSGDIDFCEFCWMGEALLYDKVSADGLKGLDVEEFKRSFSDMSSLRNKFRTNLLNSHRTGELQSVFNTMPGEEDPEKIEEGNRFCRIYPEWRKIYDEAKGTTIALSKKKFTTAVRKACPSATRKAIQILFGSADADHDGVVDWCEFCWLLQAIISGDTSHFPSVDSEEFNRGIAETKSAKAACMSKLKSGLSSGKGQKTVRETPQVPGETDDPGKETEVPATDAEAQETETPAKETETPAKETETPAKETEVPAKETEVPTADAEAPAVEAEAPAKEAEAAAIETNANNETVI